MSACVALLSMALNALAAGDLRRSILSDECFAPGQPNFTGAFVGMACEDLAGTRKPADFDWFEYRERDYLPDPCQ